MMDISWIREGITQSRYFLSRHADDLVIITTYVPSPPKFSDPYRRNR